MNFTLLIKNKFRLVLIVTLVAFSFLLGSCHKSPGAICNDGHRSYSTGRGTCSYHGGVDHYINTDEISIPGTLGLIVVIIFAGAALFAGKTRK